MASSLRVRTTTRPGSKRRCGLIREYGKKGPTRVRARACVRAGSAEGAGACARVCACGVGPLFGRTQ